MESVQLSGTFVLAREESQSAECGEGVPDHTDGFVTARKAEAQRDISGLPLPQQGWILCPGIREEAAGLAHWQRDTPPAAPGDGAAVSPCGG